MATIPEALALAIQQHQAGRLQAAEQIYRQILQVDPNQVDALHLLGVVSAQVGKHDIAVEYLGRATQLKPNHADAHNNLGNALKLQGKLDEAIACYERALELKPDNAGAHHNRGDALREQGKLDEAVACYRREVALKPDFAPAHNVLGNALKEQGKLDEAVACYRRALGLKPDFADAHNNLGLVLLLTGDFQRGWAEHEWRWQTGTFHRRDLPQPLWDGQPLAGRTILLHAEQGLGDTLQFVRYASLVKQRGGRVVVECPRSLLALLAVCPGIDQLVAQGDPLPAFEVQAPLLSLPGILGTTLDSIPARVPYLQADPELTQAWRKKLQPSGGFKVGIAWQGNASYRGDRQRSIPLCHFAPLAEVSGVSLISLQKGAGSEQMGKFPGLAMDLGPDRDTAAGAFVDTAAIMKNLDLVITSDTSIPHLAGALAVPTWLAIPHVPDFRWLLEREDSPWYPTLRLFRQVRPDDWNEVFERIATALHGLIAARTGGTIAATANKTTEKPRNP